MNKKIPPKMIPVWEFFVANAYQEEFEISITDIATKIKKSRYLIIKSINHLEAMGILHVQRGLYGDSKRSHVYFVADKDYE